MTTAVPGTVAARRGAVRRAAPVDPLALFDHALRGGDVRVRERGGSPTTLDVRRWLAPADLTDLDALRRVCGPVLDVGCGPGRHAAALAERDVTALGIEPSAEAVRLARRRGAPAVRGSVFGPVPGAGSWRTALLLDGNAGIGGDFGALRRRLRAVLAPGGELLVELAPPGARTGVRDVRLESNGAASAWFPWDRIAADAPPAGTREVWRQDDRWFCLCNA